MGRTVTETALRVPGEHHLITTKAHDGGDVFASVHELGGRIETFPMSDADAPARPPRRDRSRRRAPARRRPRAAARPAIRPRPVPPGPDDLRLAGPARAARPGSMPAGSGLRVEQRPAGAGAGHGRPAARPRAAVACCALKPRGVLTPDPRVLERLVRLRRAGQGTALRRTCRRPPRQPHACGGRGPDRHLRRAVRDRPRHQDAHRRVPRRPRSGAGRPPAPAAAPPRRARRRSSQHVAASPVADAIDVVTDPIPDLLGELAAAQVGLLAVPRRLHHLAAGHGGRRGHGRRPAGRVHAGRLRALRHAPGHRRHRRAPGRRGRPRQRR